MSFILDALKKSETDRQRQASPALFEVKVAQPRRKFPLWAAGLAVLLGVNMLVLVWVLLRRRRRRWPRPRRPSTAPRVPGSRAARHGDGPGDRDAAHHGQYPDQLGPEHQHGPARPGAGVVGPGSTPPLVEEPLLQGQEPAVPPDYDSRDYRPALTPAQAGAIAAARRNGDLPSRDEVLAQGSQLPDLRLDLHVYAVNPAERFVFINMRKLREGESLPEGVRVDEITSNGVELSYRGKQFALAGN